MTSSFPAPDNPGVAVDVYRGDLGMEGGRAQSVFSIDTSQVDKGLLTKQARANLMVGESITLDDGTQITFTGFNEWVSLQTSFDPAQLWALIFAVTMLVGLMVSLVFKRRRVWFRLRPVRCPTRPARTRRAGPAGRLRAPRRRTVPWWRSAGWPAPTRQDTARNSPRWPCFPARGSDRQAQRLVTANG